MSNLDIGVLVILGMFLISGMYKGFIKTCMGFVPLLVSLIATSSVYPHLSKFLRGTGLYLYLNEGVAKTLKLDVIFPEAIAKGENGLIESLKLPEFFKTSLLENNNPVVYKILGVDKAQDYVSGYVANICINVLSMIIVFVAIFVLVKLVLSALDLVAKLPVISFFNKTGGAVGGLIEGIVVLWIVGIVLVYFYSNPKFDTFFQLLQQSKIALFLYENNLLLFMILKIFA